MNLEDIAKKIVEFQIKHPKKIIWLFVILALLFIPGIFNLIRNVEPSLEKVLPQNIEEIKIMNSMRSEFGADMVYLIAYTNLPLTDIRNARYLKYINQLSSKIETHNLVINVAGIDDIVMNMNNGIIPDSEEQIRESIKVNPFSKQYLNLDYSFSVIKVQTSTGSSSQLIDDLIKNIKEDISTLEVQNPGVSIDITGSSAIDRATFNIIISDFAFITIFSMLLVMIVVYFTFGSFSKGMLPMIIVINALIWTMGIIGYLQLTLTVVSMVAAAMLMGLGIDFGIHQVYNYFELRKTKNPKKALTEVMSELLRAMLGASLTTIVGFLALLFGVLTAMKILGIILAIGIFTTLIGAIFLLPVIIYLYDTKINNKK